MPPFALAALARARSAAQCLALSRVGPVLATCDGREWLLDFAPEPATDRAWEWLGRPLDTLAELTAAEFVRWAWGDQAGAWALVWCALDAALVARGVTPEWFAALLAAERTDGQLGVDLVLALRAAVARRYPASPLGRAVNNPEGGSR